jgi:hypothetical protein
VVKVGLGDRPPLQGLGLMGVLLTQAFERVKKSEIGDFISCMLLKIQVRARHGVPVRRFFHTFFSLGFVRPPLGGSKIAAATS